MSVRITASHFSVVSMYGKSLKILYTKDTNKMAYANRADPDQTAPEGAVWSGSKLFAFLLFWEILHTKQNFVEKDTE